jgi:hypothetical protein
MRPDLEETDFQQARRRALWNELLTFLRRRPNRLLSWAEVEEKLGVQGFMERGMHQVPVEQIVGSVGRSRDFDRTFMPANDALATRWRSIDRAYYQGGSLPPVELYQVGEVYFCLDGHHRVSVARQKGLEFITAHVIEVQTRVPVGDRLDARELELKEEHARFLERTDLDKLEPDQQVEVTIKGGYGRLMEQIERYGQAMSLERGETLSVDVAAFEWYDRVYMPLVEIIRRHALLEDFPAFAEGDLYLWIVEHQQYLQAACGPDVDVEQVALHYGHRRARNFVERVTAAVREWIAGPSCEWVMGPSQEAPG